LVEEGRGGHRFALLLIRKKRTKSRKKKRGGRLATSWKPDHRKGGQGVRANQRKKVRGRGARSTRVRLDGQPGGGECGAGPADRLGKKSLPRVKKRGKDHGSRFTKGNKGNGLVHPPSCKKKKNPKKKKRCTSLPIARETRVSNKKNQKE